MAQLNRLVVLAIGCIAAAVVVVGMGAGWEQDWFVIGLVAGVLFLGALVTLFSRS